MFVFLLLLTCVPHPEAQAQEQHPFFQRLNPHAFWQAGELPGEENKKQTWIVLPVSIHGKPMMVLIQNLPDPKRCVIRKDWRSRPLKFKR